jgi:hypothetical protein
VQTQCSLKFCDGSRGVLPLGPRLDPDCCVHPDCPAPVSTTRRKAVVAPFASPARCSISPSCR